MRAFFLLTLVATGGLAACSSSSSGSQSQQPTQCYSDTYGSCECDTTSSSFTPSGETAVGSCPVESSPPSDVAIACGAQTGFPGNDTTCKCVIAACELTSDLSCACGQITGSYAYAATCPSSTAKGTAKCCQNDWLCECNYGGTACKADETEVASCSAEQIAETLATQQYPNAIASCGSTTAPSGGGGGGGGTHCKGSGESCSSSGECCGHCELSDPSSSSYHECS